MVSLLAGNLKDVAGVWFVSLVTVFEVGNRLKGVDLEVDAILGVDAMLGVDAILGVEDLIAASFCWGAETLGAFSSEICS